ncbi:HEL314Cp [Eremothecium sinecaudum]|uniref:HEL314Cp n=1 Tax=Eremothecium sinecaudum TaxID=45286 RepID=A0A0X8HT38_9SACH|nr:HEL314Cp [Eremothecium sinecaudum]AMD20967.1 HEL314Cp [Eremothecium sinecaudum]
MSVFTALNSSPHDALLEAEVHSRELQVEESFRVFQSALYHLKAKRFEDAEEKFVQLFNIDVLKPDQWGFYKYSSPTLDSLRYLAYRNRGVFYYQYVKENMDKMDKDGIVDCILKVVENLVQSLQHSNGDAAVTKLLLQVFKGFKTKRLQRWILEYEATKEPDETLLIGRGNALLPEKKRFIKEYLDLLSELKEFNTSASASQMICLIKDSEIQPSVLPPVLDRIGMMKEEDDVMMKELDEYVVNLDELSWECIAESFRNLVPKFKYANLFSKIPDPYSEAKEPVESIKFVYNEKRIERDVIEVKPCNEEGISVTASELTSSLLRQQEQDEGGSSVKPEDKRESEEHSETQRPAQRSSKRFKVKNPEFNETELLKPHVGFFEIFNRCTDFVGSSEKLDVERLNPESISVEYPGRMAMLDFYECLNSWTSKHTEFLNQNDSKGTTKRKGKGEDSFQVISLLRSSMFTDENHPTISLTELPNEDVLNFVSTVNDNKLHFHAVRLLLLDRLLSVKGPDETCLITDSFWSPILFDTIESFAVSMESTIFDIVYAQRKKYDALGLSVYEVLVNMLSGIYTEMTAKKLSGSKVGELDGQKNKLGKKLDRWIWLLDQINFEGKLKFRYLWSKFCYLQCISEVTDERLVISLDHIIAELNKSNIEIDISYANYQHTPRLHIQTVQSQRSKIKMVCKFTMMPTSDTENEDESNHDQLEALSRVLLVSTELDAPEEIEMAEFVKQSPFLLKLKLWRIVLDHYLTMKDHKNFQLCYFKVLGGLYDRLCSKEYSNQSQLQRQQTLLSTLSLVKSFTSLFIELISDHNKEWEIIVDDDIADRFELLTRVFIVIYPLIYFETLSNNRNRKFQSFFKKAAKSSSILKDIFIDIVCMLIMLFRKYVETKDSSSALFLTVDLICELHSLIGGFQFCDSGSGNFLNLAESFFCSVSNSSTFTPLRQILLCKYHLSIGGDSLTFEEHNTNAHAMDLESAVRLAKYLIRYEYQNKNPFLITTSRSNFKQLIDNVIEVIGKVNYSKSHILSRNFYFFEQYLESPVNVRTIREALNGTLEIELTKPCDGLQEIIDLGLYYISGVQLLNFYKLRKKTLQARPSELDSIIETLKTDILYKTNRFETWLLLGKCYSYVVEDDLIWTSDKLVVPAKKATIASVQRKAIMCYLMALSLCQAVTQSETITGTQKSENELIIREIYEALALELLNAHHKPMDSLCFQWNFGPTLLLTEDRELVESPGNSVPSISVENIYHVTLLSFQKAYELHGQLPDSTQNWLNIHYIVKLRFKLEKADFAKNCNDLSIEACNLAIAASTNGDVILEPHYSLVVKCYKSVKNDWITVTEGMKQLSMDNDFFAQDASFFETTDSTSKSDFYKKVIELLRKLLASDKRKWHHRPRYRIAKVLFDDFGDIDGAIEEMGQLMALKSVNKNLVNIWKPEYERPGKHFVYTYQYVMFYLNLLSSKHDYISLGHAARKMRRFGSGMINGAQATDRAVELFLTGARTALELNEKEHAELLLPSLNYQAFNKNCDDLIASFNQENYTTDVLDTLSIAYQLKKGSSSIAFDGVCLSIFFKYFYLPWTIEHVRDDDAQPQQPVKFVDNTNSTPSADPEAIPQSKSNNDTKTNTKQVSSRKRVSKKDTFDKVSQIVDKIT